jgi:hypothetical protein
MSDGDVGSPVPPTPPQPPPPVGPAYQVPPANGLAIAALVLGILSVVLLWMVWGGIVLGVLGIVFGAIGLSRAKAGAPNKGPATAGLILGIVGLVGSVLFVVLILTTIRHTDDRFFHRIDFCLDHPHDQAC